MNIEINRTQETVTVDKVEVAPVILTPAQLDGIIELLIANGVSATERLSSANLQSITITSDVQQGASEDGTHTVFNPVYRVDVSLKM